MKVGVGARHMDMGAVLMAGVGVRRNDMDERPEKTSAGAQDDESKATTTQGRVALDMGFKERRLWL